MTTTLAFITRPRVATLLIVAALGVWAVLAVPTLRELAWLSRLPRADAAAPTSSPARYAGTLHGPPDRRTPSGTRAAAFWWAVIVRGDDSARTTCSGRERSSLALETATGRLRIAWAGARPEEVGLVSNQKDDEHGRPLMIDLGKIGPSIPDRRPASTCSPGRYEQLSIPPGTPVEIVGCARRGAIDRCATPLAGLLAVGGVDAYRRNRARHTVKLLRYALIFAGVILLLAAGVLIDARASLLPVRPGKDP